MIKEKYIPSLEKRFMRRLNPYGTMMPVNGGAGDKHDAFGLLNPPRLVGTLTGIGSSKHGQAAQASTGTTIDTPAGYGSQFAWMRLEALPYQWWKLNPGISISDVRLVVGWVGQLLTNFLSTDDPASTFSAHYIAFSFSTSRGDTNWQLDVGNGSTQSLTDTGVAPTLGVPHYFELVSKGDTSLDVDARIYNVNRKILFQQNVTSGPSISNSLRPMFGVQNLSANDRRVEWYGTELVIAGATQ